MADQMYSMCWGPAQGSQHQAEDQHKHGRYARQAAPGSGQDSSNEEIGCVTMAADSLVSQETNCKTPGYCINGKAISLAHLAQNGLEVEVPSGMVLAGAKSPMLGKIILVAAVDKRFLPCDTTSPTTLGFSGSCIGCGEPHFRYFTEFANHINLILATQPKKQKHLKCYIFKDNLGRLCRGPRIPWRETPRKRPFPYPTYQSVVDGKTPRHLPPEVSSSTFIAPGIVNMNHSSLAMREGRSSTSSQSSCDSGSSFDPATPPLYKRGWEDADKDGETLPPHVWLEAVCGVRPVLVLGYPNHVPHFVTCYKEIVLSDMLAECFEVLNNTTRPSSTNLQITARPQYPQQQTAQQSRGMFNHPEMRPEGSQSGSFGLPPLSVNVLVILMAQYLSTLSDESTISKEDFHKLIQNSKELFWQTYQENSTIQPFFLTIDSANLVHFASLATLPSKGSVKLVSSVLSLNDAISKGLGFLYQISKHNQHRETKLQVPHYLLLLSSPPAKSPEFCVMVTGINQAKSLQEYLIRDNCSVTPQELNDFVGSLDRTYQMLNTTIDNLMKQFEQMTKNKLVFLPFNGNPILKIPESEAVSMLPKIATSFQSPEFELHTTQVSSAHHLLSCVLASKDGVPSFNLRHFSSVDFAVVIPPSHSYFHQILHQVEKSDVLVELGLGPPTQSQDAGLITDHVIQNNGSEESKLRLKDFLANAKSFQDVLFVLVCDEAHRYFSPEVFTTLPFFHEILRLPNVLAILTTPVPYLFETCQSRIRPDNEVFWCDSARIIGPVCPSDHKALTHHTNLVHFGMREYTESLSWTHQIPLVREDDEFEGLVLKANVLSTVPSDIVRSYLLIHHYTTAIMRSAGMRSIEPHCTFKTLQVVRDIIECPLSNNAGRGAMLIIRVPCATVAMWAYKKLKDTRDRVGFHYRFAVINDEEESGLHIEEHFLMRLRSWRSNKASSSDAASMNDWYPKRYEDLLDLPCIVLVSGKERTGDTFPRSLKYCDFRLLNEHCQHRSTLELEFNAVSRYINSGLGTSSQDCTRFVANNKGNSAASDDKGRDTNVSQTEKSRIDTRNQFCSSYPLPVLLVSRTAYGTLQKDFFGCPKHLRLGSDPSAKWNSDQRPALVSDLPSEQSKYYRRWTKPREAASRMAKDKSSADVNHIKYYSRCFLFSGPPQVGKTASVLHFIQLLYGTLLKLQRVDVYDEVSDSLAASNEIPASEMDQPSAKILSKILFNPTLVGTRFLSVSPLHARLDKEKKKKNVKVTNGDVKSDVSNEVNSDVNGDVIPKPPLTSSVMMSSFAAYDSYHHCDECKNYREGLGPSLCSKHVITLESGDQLTFVIPSARREWFTFNEKNELRTLKLPMVTRKFTTEGWKLEARQCERNLISKTPIFTPSAGRHEQGLLNLYHAMEGRDHVHLIFVKNSELALYQKIWPNHVIVGLPPLCNSQGLGMTKDIIKEFATENLSTERQRQQSDNSNFVWPFVHIMDDSCVMWQNRAVDSASNFQDADDRSKPGDWSLLQTTRSVESSPNVTSFALIGFNSWGTGNVTQYKLNSYSVCQVHASLFLNVDATRHVSYNRRLFSWDQVDFNLHVSSQGGLVLRYNHLNVLKKRIPIGGGCGFDVTPNIDDIISLPDRDPAHVIPAPAHYLLEEYLRLKAAEKIFPAASGNAANPVLLLDCFVNLGPSITVEYRSVLSGDREAPGPTLYGGILLYLCCGYDVTKEILRDFRFCPGAKICVISSDRSSLRDQVVKLDLEEHWRFRLRDEFKTASSLGDDALYFLTGTYDG